MISELKTPLVQRSCEEQIRPQIAEHPFPTDAFINTCLTLVRPVVIMLAIRRRGPLQAEGVRQRKAGLGYGGPESRPHFLRRKRNHQERKCGRFKLYSSTMHYKKKYIYIPSCPPGAERLARQQTDACHVSCMPEMIA